MGYLIPFEEPEVAGVRRHLESLMASNGQGSSAPRRTTNGKGISKPRNSRRRLAPRAQHRGAGFSVAEVSTLLDSIESGL